MTKKISLKEATKHIRELRNALESTLAHAESMTCELNDTDDLSDYPYIQRARKVLKRTEG